MKLVMANGKNILKMTKAEWEKLGNEKGWMVEAHCGSCGEEKKEDKDIPKAKEEKEAKKTPEQHGFIDQCIKENKDKDSPGGYCASIVDKVKGTTDWRKGPKKD